MTSAALIINSPVKNYDFNKKLYIYSLFVWKCCLKLALYFKISGRPTVHHGCQVTPFFHALYYILGVVFKKIATAGHTFFSSEIICYERQKDIKTQLKSEAQLPGHFVDIEGQVLVHRMGKGLGDTNSV